MNLINLMAKIGIDDKEFVKGVKGAKKGIEGIGQTKGFQILDGAVKKGALAVGVLKTAVTKMGIEYNASLQSSTVAWTTLLGTQDKAKNMMKEIEQYASKTPFTKMGVDTMAKQLHNAGFEGENLFTQLTKFGDIGGAFGIQEDSLKEMVRQYAQVQQATVAYTEDLNILQDRGVPIYKALAEATGKSVAEVKKMASEGKISADIYNQAIDSIAENSKGAMEGQSKTFDGMISTLKDNLGMIAGKIIEPLFNKLNEILPKIIELVDGVNEKMTEGQSFMSALKESIQETFGTGALISFLAIKDAIIGIVAVWGTLKAIMTVNEIVDGLGKFKKNIGLLSDGISKLTGSMGLATKAQTLLNKVMALSPWVWVAVAIGALVAGFIYLWNTSEEFREFWINLWEVIKEKAVSAWDAISSFFTETIPETFNKIIDFFKNNWKGILLFIINPFAGAFKLLYDNCEGFRDFIDGFVNTIKDFFVNVWGGIVSFFTESIPSFVESVIEWLSELPGKIWEFINEAPGQIGEAIGYILGTIVKIFLEWWNEFVLFWTVHIPQLISDIGTWFAELPGRIGEWLSQVWTDFSTWIVNLYNTASVGITTLITNIGIWFSELPGRIWSWLVDSWNKLKQWTIDMWTTASEKIKQLVNDVGTWFAELPGRIWSALVEAWNNLVQWGRDMVNTAKDSAKGVYNAIVDGIKTIPGKMLEIGGNIVKGIWNGIVGAKDWLFGKIGDFAGGIVKGFKSALGIKSPSRVMKAQVGKYIAQGVGVGTIEEMDSVNDDIAKAMEKTVDSARVPLPYYKQTDFKDSLKTMFKVELNMDIDGREFVRKTVAPHQDELEDYNRMTTTAFSY